MMTIFHEVSIGETFMHCFDHVYYKKIDEKTALRRSPGGDQPDMRQETVFHPASSVITRQNAAQMPSDLLTDSHY